MGPRMFWTTPQYFDRDQSQPRSVLFVFLPRSKFTPAQWRAQGKQPPSTPVDGTLGLWYMKSRCLPQYYSAVPLKRKHQETKIIQSGDQTARSWNEGLAINQTLLISFKGDAFLVMSNSKHSSPRRRPPSAHPLARSLARSLGSRHDSGLPVCEEPLPRLLLTLTSAPPPWSE